MPSVASIKSLYLDLIAPGNPAEFLRLLTEADLRLLESGKWQWCKARETLTATDGIITLPANRASILGAHLDGHPATVSLEDFEFSPEGPGEIDVDGGVNLRLIDQGLDDDDRRTYKVVGGDAVNMTIIALCMKAPALLYDPDEDESGIPDGAVSETICPDHGALKLAMYCMVFEEANDLGTSAAYMAKAINRLNSREGNSQRGGARAIPNIRPNGPGIRGIRTFR